jgi:dienelactone hydrolase
MALPRLRKCCVGLTIAGALVWAGAACADVQWKHLQAFYAYDASLPLQATSQVASQNAQTVVENITFGSAAGETVPAMLYRPAGGPAAPVVLFLHGLGGDRTNVSLLAPFLCPAGIAALSIDAQYHGNRKAEGKAVFSSDLLMTLQAFRQTIVDNRRALDYIASRPDLDASRVVLIGASMGGIMGSIVAGLDERVKAALLIVGGGDLVTLFQESQIAAASATRGVLGEIEPFRPVLEFIEPTRFVAHIAPRPLWMLNGRGDQIIPPQCAQALFDAAADPKQIEWYDGGTSGGHIPPLPVLGRQLREFLAAQGLPMAGNG